MPSNTSRSTRFYPLSKQSHFITSLSIGCLLALFFGKVHHLNCLIVVPRLPIALSFLLLFLIFHKKPKFGRVLLLFCTWGTLYICSSNFQYSLSVYHDLFGKEINIVAVVQDDAAYNTYGDYEFNVTNITFAEDGEYLPGRIRVRTKQNTAVYRGNHVLINGKLKPALGARTGSISYASVEVIESDLPLLEKMRLKFFASVYTSLPEPHASLGIGFLAGVRSSIPKTFQDQLSRVGLTHIIAVSGYNLTILVLAVSKLGKKLSKYQRAVISLSLILVFLLITGFSPSVVRAAVVCLISISCTFFGRKISPVNLILVSAAITAGFNPTYLLEDIGWWLSFLAFFGVLALAPAITGLAYKGDSEPPILLAIIIESLSAQILTTPLIAHVFGTFSIISLVANIFVIPWIPSVMLLIFIVGVTGMISPHLGIILGLGPKIVLTPIVVIIEKLSSLSWASAQLKFSEAGMLIFYILIGVFIIIANSKISRKTEGRE